MLQEDTLTITVAGKENVEWIRSKMRSGNFLSETDVVAEGIAALRKDDEELEGWLRDVIAARSASHQDNPELAIPAQQVRKNLEELRQKRAQPAS